VTFGAPSGGARTSKAGVFDLELVAYGHSQSERSTICQRRPRQILAQRDSAHHGAVIGVDPGSHRRIGDLDGSRSGFRLPALAPLKRPEPLRTSSPDSRCQSLSRHPGCRMFSREDSHNRESEGGRNNVGALFTRVLIRGHL
jgi:hypothetical protein